MTSPAPDEEFNADGVRGVTEATREGVTDSEGTDVTAGDARIDGPLEGTDEDSKKNNERTRDTHRTIGEAADDLDEEDGASADKMDFGTGLSSDSAGSPSGYSPAQQMPVSAPQPQMQAPQMPMPQMQAPQMPAGTQFIKPEALSKLVGNYSPGSGSGGLDKKSAKGGDSISSSDKIGVDEVEYKMREGPPLTRGQFNRVLEEAMDKVGIPEDKKIRSEWKELYQFMAQHESSRNPNAYAASASDYNVQISGNEKGPDGAPIHTSRGILQCIPSTFASYHVAGTSTNIYDPVASAAASMNYVIRDPKYNVSADGSGLAEFAANRGFPNGSYRGY